MLVLFIVVKNKIPLWMDIERLLHHPSVNRQLTSTAKAINVKIKPNSAHIPQSGVARLCDDSVSSLLCSCQTDFSMTFLPIACENPIPWSPWGASNYAKEATLGSTQGLAICSPDAIHSYPEHSPMASTHVITSSLQCW